MLNYSEDQFAGQECIQLTNGTLTLHALKNAGPRITGLQINGGRNLFAELPDSVKAGDYILRGGQRVWHGPEDIIRSYQPDGEPVEVDLEGRRPFPGSEARSADWHPEDDVHPGGQHPPTS